MNITRHWMTDDAARQAFIGAHRDASLVSPDMPLRANLSVLDNIALIPQYRANLHYEAAADQAWALLLAVGQSAIAFRRDPDLNHEERCVTKLLRAVIGQPPVILVDRPGMLLPDLHYPPYLDALLGKLSGSLKDCWIVDYAWNAPLYPNP